MTTTVYKMSDDDMVEKLIQPFLPKEIRREYGKFSSTFRHHTDHILAFPLPFGPNSGISKENMGAWNAQDLKWPQFLKAWLLIATALEDRTLDTPSFDINSQVVFGYYKELLYNYALYRTRTLAKHKQEELLHRLKQVTTFYPTDSANYSLMKKAVGQVASNGDLRQEDPNQQRLKAPPPPMRQLRAKGSAGMLRADQIGNPDYEPESNVYPWEEEFRKQHQIALQIEPEDSQAEESDDESDDSEDGGRRKKKKRKKVDSSKPWESVKVQPRAAGEVPREKAEIWYMPVYEDKGGEANKVWEDDNDHSSSEDDSSSEEDEDDRSSAPKVIGYIMFVAVNDPNYNPSTVLKKIVNTKPLARQATFPMLNAFAGAGHPVFSLTQDTLLQLAESFAVMDPDRNIESSENDIALKTARLDGAVDHKGHFCNFSSWATVSHAVNFMREMGGRVPDASTFSDYDKKNKVTFFTKPPGTQMFQVHMEHHVQRDDQYAGFFNWVWPHKSEFLQMEKFRVEEEDPLGAGSRFRQDASMIYRKNHIKKWKDLMPYRCLDTFQHLYYEQLKQFKDEVAPYKVADPYNNQRDYEEYCKRIRPFRLVRKQAFVNAWNPATPTTDSLKNVIVYTFDPKIEDISSTLFLLDDNMTPFGNHIIRLSQTFRINLKVEDTFYPIIARYGFATYYFNPGTGKVHMVVSGDPGTSKTYGFLDILRKTCIPQTVTIEAYKSLHVDTSGHSVDEIRQADEGQMLNNNKKDQLGTNLSKVLLDSGLIWAKRAKVDPKTNDITVTQRANLMTSVYQFTTNSTDSNINDAIIDRVVIFHKAQAMGNPQQMEFTEVEKMPCSEMLKNEQAAIAIIYKAIAVGYIGDINLDIYKLIMGSIVDFLKLQGYAGNLNLSSLRIRNKVMRLLHHYTIVAAVQEAVFLPGGSCYKHPDWREDLPGLVSPYLYPRLDVFYWCLMSLSHLWVYPEWGAVLRAASAVAGMPFSHRKFISLKMDGETYTNIKEVGVKDAIIDDILTAEILQNASFRTVTLDSKGEEVTMFNTSKSRHFKEADKDNQNLNYRECVDLNYVKITGKIDAVARLIQDKLPSDSKLGMDYIMELMKKLQEVPFRPPGGSLRKMEIDRYDTALKGDDVVLPRVSGANRDMLMIVKKDGNDWYFAVEASRLFNREILTNAFTHATVSGKTKPRKYMDTSHMESDRSIFNTIPMTKEDIAEKTKMISEYELKHNPYFSKVDVLDYVDEIGDEVASSQGKGKQEDVEDFLYRPMKLYDSSKPVPRELGLSFPLVNKSTEPGLNAVTLGELDPNMDRQVYRAQEKRFQQFYGKAWFHLTIDIDDYCAQWRHTQDGRSFSTPVQTPAYTRHRYKKAMADEDLGLPEVPPSNYPIDYMPKEKLREQFIGKKFADEVLPSRLMKTNTAIEAFGKGKITVSNAPRIVSTNAGASSIQATHVNNSEVASFNFVTGGMSGFGNGN